MAEVFGVFTGGVGLAALAVELGKCAVKLKDFTERVKNIPADLANYAHELEAFSEMLHEQKAYQQREPHESRVLTRCVQDCERATNKACALIEKLECRVGKFSVVGKACAAMRLPEISKLMNELAQVNSSFGLALQIYYFSIQSRRDEQLDVRLARWQNDVVEHVEAKTRAQTWPCMYGAHQASQKESQAPNLSSCCNSAPSRKEAQHAGENPKRDVMSAPSSSRNRKRWTRKAGLRVAFLSWLHGHMWDLEVARSSWGWNFSITTWNVVSDSPIFEYCRDGNLHAVKAAIAEGSASFLDVDDCGLTLLDIAAMSDNLDLCRFLPEESSFPDRSEVILKALSLYVTERCQERGRPPLDPNVYRAFMERSDVHLDLKDNWKSSTIRQCSSEHCVKIIMRNQSELYVSNRREMLFEDILQVLSRSFVRPSVGLLLSWLGETWVTRELAVFVNSQGYTILRTAALATLFGMRDIRRDLAAARALTTWMRFLRDLITLGANPLTSVKTEHEDTPLLTALRIFMNDVSCTLEIDLAVMSDFIKFWITTLERAGVDIDAYWIQEANAWWQQAYSFNLMFRGPFEKLPIIEPTCPTYCDASASWSFEAIEVDRVDVFELKLPLGSWSTPSNPIKKIIWEPDPEEEQE